MKRVLIVTIAAVAFLATDAQAQFASPVQILPVVVKAKGKVGTDWRSSVMISNLSGRSITVGATYFPEGTTNTYPDKPGKTFSMAAGETKVVADVIGSWFSQYGTNTKGMLWIMTDDGGSSDPARLVVTSRAFNAADPQATYGQTVAPNLFAMVFGLGKSVLTGIQQDSTARTNIGVVNLSPMDVSVEVSIYDAGGALKKKTLRGVKGLSIAQWSLSSLGVSSLAAGRVEVRPDPNAPAFDPCGDPAQFLTRAMVMSYSSKVQQSTGDAEFNVGQVDWEAFKFECGTTPVDDCTGNPLGQQMMSRVLGMVAGSR